MHREETEQQQKTEKWQKETTQQIKMLGTQKVQEEKLEQLQKA